MNELYTYTVFPIEIIYKYIYLALVSLIENYGIALLILSLLNYFLLIPLNNLVRGLQERENNIQEILEPQLKDIKETSRNEARHKRIQKLYERYSYHPIFAIRTVFPLLVQLPFLMAVYFMLSGLSILDGVGFLFLENLAQPDAVLFGLPIMPFVMTAVSLVNACFVVKLSKSQRKQAVIVALLFFALLYTAPSALLLYWTMNNILIVVFSLARRVNSIEKARLGLLSLKARVIPSLMNSSGLFLFICFFLPLFFTISHNINSVSELQISHFVIFASAALCVFFLVGGLLDKLLKASRYYSIGMTLPFTFVLKKNIDKDNFSYILCLKHFIYLLIALASAYIITRLCLNIRLYSIDTIAINFVSLGTAILLFFIIIKCSFKSINTVLLSLCAFTCIILAHKQKAIVEKNIQARIAIQNAESQFPMDEKLNNRPNVYLFLLESYMNSSVLKETYGFDNSPFENKLRAGGFNIYENTYAHGPFTKCSLLNLFLIRDDIQSLLIGNQDVTPNAYTIFGGNRDNILFRYLKKNDYTISCFYDSQSYYIPKINELIDYPTEDIYSPISSLLLSIAPTLHIKQQGLKKVLFNTKYIEYDYDIYPKVIQHLSARKESDPPAFYLLKPANSLHYNPKHGELLENYQTWITSGVHQRGVLDMNEQLLAIIEQIEKYDPQSVIVLVGDHGHKYVAAVEGHQTVNTMTPRQIQEKYPHLQISSQEYIDDLFSVFLAIKMPKSAKGKLLIDSDYAYADLFRYIFAALDNNPAFLEHKSSNISFNIKGTVIRKGEAIIEDGENKQ